MKMFSEKGCMRRFATYRNIRSTSDKNSKRECLKRKVHRINYNYLDKYKQTLTVNDNLQLRCLKHINKTGRQ